MQFFSHFLVSRYGLERFHKGMQKSKGLKSDLLHSGFDCAETNNSQTVLLYKVTAAEIVAIFSTLGTRGYETIFDFLQQ